MTTPFSTFNAYGLTLKTSNGDVNLLAGNNITLTPSGSTWVISAIIPPTANAIVNGNGVAWQPPSLADADAPNNSIYYSTDASKLSYRDPAGISRVLY